MNKNNRRKALKALAVTAPAVWAKPVVDTVVLPAHGAMTGECVQLFDGQYTFVNGQTLPCGTSFYFDSNCTSFLGSSNIAIVFAPDEISAAGECSNIGAGTVELGNTPLVEGYWSCTGCEVQ